MADRPSPLLLDLVATNAVAFSLDIEIPKEHESKVLRGLGVNRARAKKQQPSFVHHYRKSRRRHEAFGHLYIGGGQTDRLRCHIRFDLEPISYPEDVRQFDELVTRLQDQELSVVAHCEATFRYELQRVNTIIPLPWRLLEYEGAPFDEVRGFRVVKRADQEEVRFSAIVDMTGQDRLHVSLAFDEAGDFSRNFVEVAFARALDYASRLVRRKEGD